MGKYISDVKRFCKRFPGPSLAGSCFIILLLVFIFVFYSIYFVVGDDEDRTIRIAMNMWPGYSHHTFIALEKDFFEKEGVNVEVNLFDGYMDSLDAFKGGGFDGFFGVYSDAVLLAAEGYPVSVVYVADFSNGGDVIMASPDIEMISDLKGKTIGIAELNSFSHLFVLALLEKNGLSESDVNIINGYGSDVLEMLESGYIDAGHTMEPIQSEALAKGYNSIASSADVPNSIIDVLVIRKEIVDAYPEKVKGIVEGLFRAERFLVGNPEESNSYISKKTGVDSSDLNEELKGIKILNEEENRNIFDRNKEGSLYNKGNFIIEFFLEKGIISEALDLDEFIDPRFVDGSI